MKLSDCRFLTICNFTPCVFVITSPYASAYIHRNITR